MITSSYVLSGYDLSSVVVLKCYHSNPFDYFSYTTTVCQILHFENENWVHQTFYSFIVKFNIVEQPHIIFIPKCLFLWILLRLIRH